MVKLESEQTYQLLSGQGQLLRPWACSMPQWYAWAPEEDWYLQAGNRTAPSAGHRRYISLQESLPDSVGPKFLTMSV